MKTQKQSFLFLKNSKYNLELDYIGWKNNKEFTQLNSEFLAQKKWNSTLFKSIIENISCPIHKQTIRGGFNLIICSSLSYNLFNEFNIYDGFDKTRHSFKLTSYNSSSLSINEFNSKYSNSLHSVGTYKRGNHETYIYIEEQLPSDIMIACYTEFDLKYHLKSNWTDTVIDEDLCGVIKIKNLK